MIRETVFIGDIHGNVQALRALWAALPHERIRHTVLLGDYVNKGPASAEVLTFLVELVSSGSVTLLRGNHDDAMLAVIEKEELAPFLKMGGAMTIRSYVGGPVGPDVLQDFIPRVPRSHIELLRGMSVEYTHAGVVAKHTPWELAPEQYTVSAHRFVGLRPRIHPNGAQIDTGCGDHGGRLTALLWPSLGYLQVGGSGEVIYELAPASAEHRS